VCLTQQVAHRTYVAHTTTGLRPHTQHVTHPPHPVCVKWVTSCVCDMSHVAHCVLHESHGAMCAVRWLSHVLCVWHESCRAYRSQWACGGHDSSTTHRSQWACGCIRVMWFTYEYGMATVSRIHKIKGLFCKRDLQKRRYFAKETYNLIDPTDRSHPIGFSRLSWSLERHSHKTYFSFDIGLFQKMQVSFELYGSLLTGYGS